MLSHRTPLRSAILVGALVTAPLAACGSSGGGGSSTSSSAVACDSPGVTATEIKVGDLYPLSGSTVSQRNGWGGGVRARFELLDDSGGVNGRQIAVTDKDDMGTASADLDGAKFLVESTGVFGLLQAAIVSASADYLKGQNVPVVGHAIGQDFAPSNLNYFGTFGASVPTTSSSANADFIKAHGGTVVAIIAHNNTASLPAAQTFKIAATQDGLSIGYTRLDLPFVPGDFTADAQQMKANGVNSLWSPVANAVSLALYKAAIQAGVTWKAFIFPNFYDPAQLAQVGSTIQAGAYTDSPTAPFELNLPETKKFEAALKKYESSTPVNAFSMEGWDAAELFIEGLQKAGSCPTRQGFVNALRNTHDWNGHGTVPPVDFGKPQLCTWIVKVTSTGYQPDKNPVCGKAISAA